MARRTNGAGASWGGLWALLFTAERAVWALVQVTSFAEALDLVWLGDELRAAGDTLAARRSNDIDHAVAVDLGPVLEGASATGPSKDRLASLLGDIADHVDQLGDADPSEAERLWLAGLGASVFAAREHLAGTRTR